MHKERLLKLADALRHRIPPEKFDLHNWRAKPLVGDDEDIGHTDRFGNLVNGLDPVQDDKLRNACGTTGCAIGWATALPEFQSEGFRADTELGCSAPIYGGMAAWDAVALFFKINELQARRLFTGLGYDAGEEASPIDVAEHIEKFCNEGEMS